MGTKLDYVLKYFLAFANLCHANRDDRGKIKVSTGAAFEFRRAFVLEHGDGGLGLWKMARIEAEAKSYVKHACDTRNMSMLMVLGFNASEVRNTAQGREICSYLESRL